MNNQVTIKNISKGFTNNGNRIDVLHDLDFEIKSGETIAITGASGIGKSTFLHILGTLDRPDTGNILFGKQDVFDLDDTGLAEFRNRTIGFVFQFHHLLPEFTALENVMMPVLINNFNKSYAKKAAEKVLIKVGLQDRMSHKIGKLSGGEQQRVALARAIIRKPLVLLADEPTGNLDNKNSRRIHEMLMDLNREYGMTIIVVTHNLDLAGYMSRQVTISEGRIIETDI